MLFEVNIHSISDIWCQSDGELFWFNICFIFVLKVLYPSFHAGFPKDLLRKSAYFVALKQQFTLIVKALCSLKYDREAFCPVSTNSSISPCPVPLTWIFYTFLSCVASPILDMTIGLYGTEIECI